MHTLFEPLAAPLSCMLHLMCVTDNLTCCCGNFCHIARARGTHRSWNQLGCNYDEKKIRDVADAMVTTGMLSAGYECVHESKTL